MNRITSATKFDDRMVDFLTGRKVSPAMEDRKVCDCCGQRIVKGFFTNLGTIGEDCHEVVRQAGWCADFAAYVENQRRIGWGVKPAVGRFLQQQVFA
jgi:hypothetical protein